MLISVILISILVSAVESKLVYAEVDLSDNVYATIMLHYDTYYP